MSEFLLSIAQPDDGGVTAKWIIGGMATAIVALSGYIVKLHVQLNAVQAEWAKYMREQVDLVRTLNDEVNKPPRGGQ